MSLINKMLRDLENRQAVPSGGSDPVLDDIQAVSEEDLGRRSGGVRPLTILFFAVVIAGCLAFILDNDVYSLPDLKQQADPAPQRSPAPAARPAGKTSPRSSGSDFGLKLDTGRDLPMASVNSKSAGAAPGVAVDSVKLKNYAGLINLKLGLPAKTRYLVYTLDDPSRVVLELNGARYAGALPDISSMDGVRAVRQREEDDGTYKLVVETDKPMLIDSTEMNRMKSGYLLQVSMLPEKLAAADAPLPASPAPAASPKAQTTKAKRETSKSKAETAKSPQVSRAGSMHITPVSNSNAEDTPESAEDGDGGDDADRIDNMVHEGRKLYEDGDVDKGLSKLLNAVKQAPANVKARSTLAVLLLEQGRNDMAKYILEEGLNTHPQESQWAMILGRELYSEGKFGKAQQVLQEASPSLANHEDYYALYAGVLQARKEYTRAAMVYRNLLRQHPSNGSWWLGLAISLEAMSRKDDAITAYKHALNTPQLNPDSARFAKDRLHRLSQKS